MNMKAAREILLKLQEDLKKLKFTESERENMIRLGEYIAWYFSLEAVASKKLHVNYLKSLLDNLPDTPTVKQLKSNLFELTTLFRENFNDYKI